MNGLKKVRKDERGNTGLIIGIIIIAIVPPMYVSAPDIRNCFDTCIAIVAAAINAIISEIDSES